MNNNVFPVHHFSEHLSFRASMTQTTSKDAALCIETRWAPRGTYFSLFFWRKVDGSPERMWIVGAGEIGCAPTPHWEFPLRAPETKAPRRDCSSKIDKVGTMAIERSSIGIDNWRRLFLESQCALVILGTKRHCLPRTGRLISHADVLIMSTTVVMDFIVS